MSIKSLGTSVALVLSFVLAGCTHDPAPLSPADVAHAHRRVEGLDLATIRAELAEHRRIEIARLQAYADAGVFPQNLTSDAPLHMLKDADGRLCAVANLAHLDGYDAALTAMEATRNDLEFADVKDGALHDF